MTVVPFKNNHLLLIPETLRGGNLALMNAMPAFHKWQDRNMIVRIVGANLQYIINTWPKAQWIGGSEETKKDYEHKLGAARKAVEEKLKPDILPSDDDYEYFRPPLDHQRKGFQLSRDRETFALLMEQGTGKTKIILDTAQYLYKQNKINMLLVVAFPFGVHQNWVENECPLDIGIPYHAEYWRSSYNTLSNIGALKRFIMATDRLRIFTFSIESFNGNNGRAFILQLLKNNRCMMVIDQSACIKNPNAKRTKFVINECSELAHYRRILDGDPVAEGADELYSQFKFLDHMIIGHDTWTGFKAEYCKENFFGGIAGYKNLDDLRAKIDGYCYRVTSDECQDLPPRIYKKWDFDLGPEERRIFDELKGAEFARFRDDAPAEEEGDKSNTMEEHLALVKNMRLQQISSGWWPKDPFRQIEATERKGPHKEQLPSRCKALLKLLESVSGEKALIFARFRADLELLQRVLGPEAVSYHGGIGQEARAEAKRRFMKDPKTIYFLGQPRSAGIGHTLTAAKHVIFYSNDPSYRLRAECEKRAHREGLKHQLYVWDLIASRTQDMKLINALKNKRTLSAEILQDPVGYFLDYEE